MPVSADYQAYVIDQLAGLAQVRSRRMFGGVGLYANDVFFGLIDDDTLYFKVDDIDRAYADLKARGVDFRDEPHLIAKMPDHELWMAFFRDGEGNTLALMHEKR